MPAKVFVGNLNFQTTSDELADLMADAGQVVDVYLPTDRATGRARGFAFVEFSSEDEANEAIEKFDEYEFAGRMLKVNLAEDRPKREARSFRPFPPGGGGGRPGGFGGGGGGRPSKPKGSRRGKRGQKRSL